MTAQHTEGGFTPGPWSLDREAVTVTAANTGIICDIYGPACEWRDANARLIAAAPDLYEALRNMRHWAEVLAIGGVMVDEWQEKYDRHMEQANTALSKAPARPEEEK